MSALLQIRLERVTKVRGRSRVLHDVSCTFTPQRLSLIMGPNGAGKSTLLHILSTLVKPTSGDVWFGRDDYRTSTLTWRHRIGFVAHQPLLYLDLTAFENLCFFAKAYEVATPETVAMEWLQRVGLHQNAHQISGTFSQGMLKRLSLARALISQPSVVLLDEPFSGLDRSAVTMICGEISTQLRRGVIVIMVSHDVSALTKLALHLVLLDRGKIVGEHDYDDCSTEQITHAYHERINV